MVMRMWILAVGLWVVSTAATGAPFTSLYVFGDSLSDQGNAFTLTGGFPGCGVSH
jgi:phospholipase/lecithinase/hemolysin